MDPPESNWDPPTGIPGSQDPEEEWEKHRIWISDLYQNGSTLEETISIIRYHNA